MTKDTYNNNSSAAASAAAAGNTATAAALAASKASEAIATISTDLSWMKKSLSGIEQTLKEMSGVFVSTTIFSENQKMTDDHETRIRSIENNMGKWMGAIGVITFIITIAVSYILKMV